MRSSRELAASERLDIANGRAGQTTQPTCLRATLRDLERLLRSGVGPTDLENAEILGLLRSIEIALIARQIQSSIRLTEASHAAPANDSWLTADEAAARLKRTRAWVYRQARRWSFAKRPSKKTLLISQDGLARWMEHR
jgi:hypothetical protein